MIGNELNEIKGFLNRKDRLSIKDWITVILHHDPDTFFRAIRLYIEVRVIYIRLWCYEIRNRLWGMD
jgi:hypothetical protein